MIFRASVAAELAPRALARCSNSIASLTLSEESVKDLQITQAPLAKIVIRSKIRQIHSSEYFCGWLGLISGRASEEPERARLPR